MQDSLRATVFELAQQRRSLRGSHRYRIIGPQHHGLSHPDFPLTKPVAKQNAVS